MVLLAHLHLIVLIPPRFIYQYSRLFRHSFHCLIYLILCDGSMLTRSCAFLLPGQGLSPFPSLQLHPWPDHNVKLPNRTLPSGLSLLSSQLLILSQPNTKPSHSLPSPQDPLPGPTTHLLFPCVPSSHTPDSSLLHLPFITVFSLIFLSLQQCTVKTKENS